MIRRALFPFAVLALFATGGCATPIGPVEVTRFHLPETAMLGQGAIAVVAAPGVDGGSLEARTWQDAVARQLALLGYTAGDPASAPQVAEVRVDRQTTDPVRASNPVSVGVGGSAGSYGSGVGLGIGINLSPKPAQQVSTELRVTIRERASGKVLWEGRADLTVPASSPLAGSALGAGKLSEALFKGFPGNSGETVSVP